MCSPLNHLALINTDTRVLYHTSRLETRTAAIWPRDFVTFHRICRHLPKRLGAALEPGFCNCDMNVSPYTWTYCQNWPPCLQENCPMEYTNAGLCRSQPLSNEEPYQQQAVPRKRPPRHFNIELVDKQRDKKCENDRRRGASQDKTWLPVFAGPSEETRTMRTQDFLLRNLMTTSCLRPTF